MKNLVVLVAGAALLAGCVKDRSSDRAARQQNALSGLQMLTTRAAPRSDKSLIYVGGKVFLPKWKTNEERNFERLSHNAKALGQPFADTYDDYRNTNISKFFITVPPVTTGFRVVAEYEPSQAYLMTWTQGLPANMNTYFAAIVKGAWGKVPVLMAYTTAAHKTWIEGQLTTAGIPAADLTDTTKIVWWAHASGIDSIWARDFGPVSIVSTDAAKKLSFVDFRYYHQRIHDDEIPADLATAWGINDFRPDLDYEGGNFMNTSDGACMATKGVLWANSQFTQAAVEDLFKKYLNCKKIIFPTPLTGEGTTHIDMFSKLGTDTTCMVGKYTTTQDAQNATILDQDATLMATTNGSGANIVVTRIPMPDKGSDSYGTIWNTYTNSQALQGATSKTILIPVYPSKATNETAAMAAYSTVFPGWTQVKIDSEPIISWGGAIHCVLMQIAVGAKSKMEADPAALCGQKFSCQAGAGCGSITYEGCCKGEVLTWCENNALQTIDCTSNPKCGWESSAGFYDCGTTGAAEPTGKFPKACGGTVDLGPKLDKVAPPIPDGGKKDAPPVTGCGTITYEGCCDGNVVKYCENNAIQTIDCTQNPSCGWNAQGPYYDCGTNGAAEPTGKFPKSCTGGPSPDLGPKLDKVAPKVDLPPAGCGTITYEGCCDGEMLKWCENNKVETLDCTKNPSCGWSSQGGYYDCGTNGAAEPTGKFPKSCGGGPTVDLGPKLDKVPPPDGIVKKDTGPITGCGTITYEGCCDGDTLKWCENNKIEALDCSKNPSCGWSTQGYYDCGTNGAAEPTGKYPKSCTGGPSPDLGPKKDTKPVVLPDKGGPVVNPDKGGPVVNPDEGTTPTPDKAVTKADAKKTTKKTTDGGCSCTVTSTQSSSPLALLLLGLGVLFFRRRRR